MKTIVKITFITIALVFMLIADVPLVLEQLVPEAHAILGVRRRALRRGVVIGASMSAASATAAASQQQTAQPQAVESASAIPIGTVVQSLPKGCTSIVVSNASYSDCAGVYYKAAFQGNNLVYVVIPKP